MLILKLLIFEVDNDLNQTGNIRNWIIWLLVVRVWSIIKMDVVVDAKGTAVNITDFK